MFAGLSPQMRYVINATFWTHTMPSERHLLRLESLMEFYNEDRIRNVLTPICSGASKTSLRLLDWFVINYSRKNKLHLGRTNVYQSYRNWRRFWKQDLFDICRRDHRIYFKCDDAVHSTTVAQLNYIYWTDFIGVRAYVTEHYQIIKDDMTARMRLLSKQDSNTRRKRLAVSSEIGCTVIAIPSIVNF